MKNFLNKVFFRVGSKFASWGADEWDALSLRVGLSIVLIYAGVSIIINPTEWIGYVPQFIENVYPRESALTLHGFFDLLLGVGMIFGWFLPLISFLTFLNLTTILIFSGIDAVTFRDIGLAFAALALFFRTFPRIAGNQQLPV